jgi:hypothetical protein
MLSVTLLLVSAGTEYPRGFNCIWRGILLKYKPFERHDRQVLWLVGRFIEV